VKRPAWPSLIFEVLPFVNPQRQIELTVKRGKEERVVKMQPVEMKDDDGQPMYAIDRGFVFEPTREIHVAKDFSDAVRLGGVETRDSLLLVYRFLQRIGQGQIPVTMTAGPVGIAEMAGMKVKEGFPAFLLFLTMLSANLAVVNFLPIPVLDGGHMVFLVYELVRRKPASERVVVAFTYAGLIFLLSLMLFVLALDIGIIPRF
jgi:regulator of sigma E protease